MKRFALLLACNDSEYVKRVYGGYYNVFMRAFAEEGELWDLFRVVEGEFPALEDLHSYDGFVISGSPFDAYGDEPWILQLCFLLQFLDATHKRVLGICFGHQVLCRALGGEVRRARDGWDLGVRKVVFVEDVQRQVHHQFLDGLKGMPASLGIIQCHQDEVWEVPLGAEVIGSSEKTRVEVFCIEDHALGIQGHPEYSKDILYNIIDRLVTNGSIDLGLADDARARAEECEPDSRELWEKLCKGFLKGR